MLPYAEQFLTHAQSNQWFLRFFVDANDLTHYPEKQAHMEWFEQQGLQLTQVRTHEFDLNETNFYHVNFASAQDARLTAYSAKFETIEGLSMQPDIYQLYEWSYTDWCDQGLKQTWEIWQEKTT
jgi:hypothetical protein